MFNGKLSDSDFSTGGTAAAAPAGGGCVAAAAAATAAAAAAAVDPFARPMSNTCLVAINISA